MTVTGVSGTLSETATFDLLIQTAAFGLELSPLPNVIAAGSSVTTTLTVVPSGAFPGSVELSAALPAGVTATFATNPVTTTTAVTLTASSTAPLGASDISILGSFVSPPGETGSFTEVTFGIDVTAAATPAFTLGFSPVDMTLVQGGSVSTTVTVNKLNGFTGSVALAVSSLPAGVTAALNATTGVLTLTASSSAQIGVFDSLSVTGTSGGLSATGNFALRGPSRACLHPRPFRTLR